MAGADIAAALMGGLSGYLQGHEGVQQRKRQQALDEEKARQQAFNNEMQLRQLQRQEAADKAKADADLRTDYERLFADLGPNARLTNEQVAGAQQAGLGHRVGTEQRYDDPLGLVDMGLPAPLPSTTGVAAVAETAAQRTAREGAVEQQRQSAMHALGLRRRIEQLPEHLRPAAEFGAATGKMPTFGSDDYTAPEQKRQIKWDDWRKQEDYRDTQTRGRMTLADSLRPRADRPTTDPKEKSAQRAYDVAYSQAIRDGEEPEDAVKVAQRAYDASIAASRPATPPYPRGGSTGRVMPGQGQTPEQGSAALQSKAQDTLRRYRAESDPQKRALLRTELQRLLAMGAPAR